MSTRLQVVVDAAEMAEIRGAAARQGMTVSQWVRQAVRATRSNDSAIDPARKFEMISRAAEHTLPTGDVEQMLQEIEQGYGGGFAG